MIKMEQSCKREERLERLRQQRWEQILSNNWWTWALSTSPANRTEKTPCHTIPEKACYKLHKKPTIRQAQTLFYIVIYIGVHLEGKINIPIYQINIPKRKKLWFVDIFGVFLCLHRGGKDQKMFFHFILSPTSNFSFRRWATNSTFFLQFSTLIPIQVLCNQYVWSTLIAS